jgi:LysM repeat protein
VTPRGTDTGKPAGVDLTNPTGKPTPGTPEASPGNSPATPPLPPTGSTGEITSLIAEGDRKLKANDLVGARASFSKAYVNAKTVRSDLDSLRSKLETINKDLFASAKVYPGDPMTEEYVVADGDGLQRIARRRNLVTDWRLIERTNKVDSTKLRVGQKLKLIRGPFHAVVHKSDFRVDLFWGAPKDPEAWIFVRSFRVGLGPNTPVGEFAVKPAGKMVNPPWTNPQNPAEKYGADDPKNPIGEFWIGIQGEGDAAKHKGFGLHGTIDPGSIGQDKSMGCVRLLPDDIAQVYELLMDPVGVVRIVP